MCSNSSPYSLLVDEAYVQMSHTVLSEDRGMDQHTHLRRGMAQQHQQHSGKWIDF